MDVRSPPNKKSLGSTCYSRARLDRPLHFIFIPQKYQNVNLFRVTTRMRFLNKLPEDVLAIQLVQNRESRIGFDFHMLR